MSFLSGAAALGSGVGALGSLVNALFPKQILIRIDDQDVNIDAMESAVVGTTVQISEQPAENGKVFAQNVYNNPRTITLQCILSNILRASGINSIASATQFASSLLIPEVASITNLALNEEDHISRRLLLLRDAQESGKVVQIIGLKDQDVFNFIIENISDTENVQTGEKARAIDILIKQAFIVGLDSPEPAGGRFSKITGALSGIVKSSPPALGSVA